MTNTTKSAISRAESGRFNFASICYLFARRSVLRRKNKFTSEDIIKAYHESGLPEPSELRVFGAVMVRLKKEGLIRHAGFGKYKGDQGHCKPTNIWKRA